MKLSTLYAAIFASTLGTMAFAQQKSTNSSEPPSASSVVAYV